MSVDHFLDWWLVIDDWWLMIDDWLLMIDDWCRRALPTVGDDIPRQVGPSCIRRVAEQAMGCIISPRLLFLLDFPQPYTVTCKIDHFCFVLPTITPHQPLKSSFKEVCSDNSKVESRESTHQDWGVNAVCEEPVLTAWGPKPKLQNPQFERLGEFSCILHPAHPRDEITQAGRELFSLCNFSVNLKSF